MKPHERQAIEQLFARLALAEQLSSRRDGDAERLIAELVARQPHAPYLMAQTILFQAQALKVAQQSLDVRGLPAKAKRPDEAGASNRPAAAGRRTATSVGPSDGFMEAASSVALAVSGAITMESARS